MYCKFFFAGFVLISQSFSIDQVAGKCCELKKVKFCEPKGGVLEIETPKCGDCTDQEIHCGVSNCNMMDCDCGEGCRTGPCKEDCSVDRDRTKRQDETENDIEARRNKSVVDLIIESGDTDRDGYLNLTEAKVYVFKKKRAILTEREIEAGIRLMDKNNDGYLQRHEIDS